MVKFLRCFILTLIISTNSLEAQNYSTLEFGKTRQHYENSGFRNSLNFDKVFHFLTISTGKSKATHKIVK